MDEGTQTHNRRNMLTFNPADVRRVVEHMMSSTSWEKHPFDASRRKPHPQIILVKDDGIYLMSNGNPRDLIDDIKSFAAYAYGYHPDDVDVWERAREIVGGDDFAEYMDLSKQMLTRIMGPAFASFSVKVSPTAFEIVVGVTARQKQ